jgi:hypothetical protein
VDIGNIVYFDSRLIFATSNYVCVRVQADVLDPKTGMKSFFFSLFLKAIIFFLGITNTTNIFYYNWDVQCNKKIVPVSDDDMLLNEEGRKKYELSKKREQENLHFHPYIHPVVKFPSLTAIKIPAIGPMHPFPLSAFLQ